MRYWRPFWITPFGQQKWFNSSSPRQNGRPFADDIFRCIFVNEKFCIWIKISLKLIPKGPIGNNPALVQIMAWRRIGDKPFSYTLGREYRVMRLRYSRLLFTSEDRFAPICTCKNNRRIWRHNASVLHSRDVTDQLWWRHNTKSEKTVLSDDGEISDR